MFWFDSGGFVVDRRIAIRRLRAKGRAGGGADRRKQSSRGGARPEKANWGLPDSVWAGVWLGGLPTACVIYPCAQSNGLGFGAACAAAVAGVCGGAKTACGARRVIVAYGLIGVAQTEAWGSGVLTEGL